MYKFDAYYYEGYNTGSGDEYVAIVTIDNQIEVSLTESNFRILETRA